MSMSHLSFTLINDGGLQFVLVIYSGTELKWSSNSPERNMQDGQKTAKSQYIS